MRPTMPHPHTEICFVIPTRNRPVCLADTMRHLGLLDISSPQGERGPHYEVIVLDNASAEPVIGFPQRLANGIPVRVVRLNKNLGAAARNIAARGTDARWLCMLDDDSYPLSTGFLDAVERCPEDVIAVGAQIVLPDGAHEDGGLPEVFVGCGVLIRRDRFVELGGYDGTFEYYAEEYDFCARAIAAGWRIVHDARFNVCHRKVAMGRDMNRILHLLVRNNGWVIQRYVPDALVETEMSAMLDRYRTIAKRESASTGYDAGRRELSDSLGTQSRDCVHNARQYARFTGRAAVEDYLPNALRSCGAESVELTACGKGEQIISSVIESAGVEIVAPRHDRALRTQVIGTLSPGPIANALATLARPGKVCGGDCEEFGQKVRPLIPPWPGFGIKGTGALSESVPTR